MTPEQINELTIVVDGIAAPLSRGDLPSAQAELATVEPERLADVLERLDGRRRAVAYRLLPKDHALRVFEDLSPNLQGELIGDLRDAEVAQIFAISIPTTVPGSSTSCRRRWRRDFCAGCPAASGR